MNDLPEHIIAAQTKIALIVAIGTDVADIDTFVKAWLGGYHSAMVEIGAIEEGDTEAELSFLRRFMPQSTDVE